MNMFKNTKDDAGVSTEVINIKTTGKRIPGTSRRESYILQETIEELPRIELTLFKANSAASTTTYKGGHRECSLALQKRSQVVPESYYHHKIPNPSCLVSNLKTDVFENFKAVAPLSTAVPAKTRFTQSQKTKQQLTRVRPCGLIKVSLVLCLLGLIFSVTSVLSTSWISTAVGKIGLWQICILSSCGKVSFAPSSFTAAQALSVMGFLAGVGSTVLIILYILFLNKEIVRLLALVGAFVAAGFILIGVIIVGAELNPNGSFNVGWAMIVAIIGVLIFISTGVVVVVDVVKSPPPAS